MALLRTGHIVGAMSGDLGSVNYAQTRNGLIARRALRRTNKKTSAQLLQRAKFQSVHADWLVLSDSERLAWSRSASGFKFKNRLGMPYSLSGLGLFRKIMLTPNAEGWPDNAVPPVMERTQAPEAILFQVRVTPVKLYWIDWTGEPNSASGNVLVFFSRPVSAGAINHFGNWRLLISKTPKAGSQTFDAAFDAYYGEPALGERIGGRVSFWDPPLLPSFEITVACTVI